MGNRKMSAHKYYIKNKIADEMESKTQIQLEEFYG
jgi:hypothetical protein